MSRYKSSPAVKKCSSPEHTVIVTQKLEQGTKHAANENRIEWPRYASSMYTAQYKTGDMWQTKHQKYLCNPQKKGRICCSSFARG